MASGAHQWLLTWAVRKMTSDGFLLGGFDGTPQPRRAMRSAASPFELYGCRPDAWGSAPNGSLLAFAEAKTAGDIDNAHTRRQLRIFGACRMRGSASLCPLYLAIPRAAAYELDRVLIDTHLLGAPHVIRVHVPNILLEEPLYGARTATSAFVAAPSRRH